MDPAHRELDELSSELHQTIEKFVNQKRDDLNKRFKCVHKFDVVKGYTQELEAKIEEHQELEAKIEKCCAD